MPRILIHFSRYGPYHHARLKSAHEVLSPSGWEVVGLETAGNDATYAWDPIKAAPDSPSVITAFPGRLHEDLTTRDYRRVLCPLLDYVRPDVMAIAGWGSLDARSALAWCRKKKVHRLVMSETRVTDGNRVWWKEAIKRSLISNFHGALVGSRSHRDYLVALGMRPESIAFGYNIVDNEYFSQKCQDWKMFFEKNKADYNLNQPCNPETPYFLASNRFIDRKNLSRLLDAYCTYLKCSQGTLHTPSKAWNLCLLGDGILKPCLLAKCHELRLQVIESAPWEHGQLDKAKIELKSPSNPSIVWMPGFRQVDELPRFYAHAGCFVHPALEEPWGLVINEAMACRLPILSSRNVGAAEELINVGENGWTFEPTSVDEMSQALTRVSDLSLEEHAAFSTESLRIIQERCPTRAFGQGLATLLR